jgi:ABC-type Fe3+-siderophore transport system permease subunit
MEWIKQRVWQLGIAILLALIASVLIYLAGVEENTTLLWVGLILFFVALSIPLLVKFFEAVQEREGEEGES